MEFSAAISFIALKKKTCNFYILWNVQSLAWQMLSKEASKIKDRVFVSNESMIFQMIITINVEPNWKLDAIE